MSFSYKNHKLQLVYITIENLDAKIWKSLKQSRILFLNSIFIIYKRSKDANNKNKDLKIKIHYIA